MTTRRLDSIARIRALQERLAGGDVALAQGALGRARDAETAAWDQIAAAVGLDGPVSGERMRSRHTMLARGVGHAGALGHRAASARQDLEDKVDTWRHRKQALDGIERLDERLQVEAQAEEERREMAVLDDVVVMRWKRGAP